MLEMTRLVLIISRGRLGKKEGSVETPPVVKIQYPMKKSGHPSYPYDAKILKLHDNCISMLKIPILIHLSEPVNMMCL